MNKILVMAEIHALVRGVEVPESVQEFGVMLEK